MTTIVIANPLDAAVAAKLEAGLPPGVEFIYRPDLLPAPLYHADHDGDPSWRRTDEQEREWRAILARSEIAWGFPEAGADGPRVLCPNLRWVQGTSSGVGAKVRRLGLDQSGSNHIWITTSSGIHAAPLAEFVFATLLFHAKRFPHLQAEQRAHHWERYAAGGLRGQTLAIVGPGRIGREVARLGRAFGMTVWAMARDVRPERVAELGVDRLFDRSGFHEMLAGANALVLVAPQTEDTDNLMGTAAFAALQPGAVLVNIGRGTLVDEGALLDALTSGRLGMAALDVARTEPLPSDSPLWDAPNMLISPHSASTIDGEDFAIADIFLANLEHFLADQPERMSPTYDRSKGY